MSLLNKAKVKRFTLDCAAHRAHKMSRVSSELYDAAEAVLRDWIQTQVERQPSKGKTVYPLARPEKKEVTSFN
jgi:hypothetical protein